MIQNLSDLTSNFVLFRDHCIKIRRDFNTYNILFCSGFDNLLLSVAPAFFVDIAEIMREHWILQVCKLMDPAVTKIGSHIFTNITIKLITKQLEDIDCSNDDISKLSFALIEYGDKLLLARNKRLAHRDREYQLNQVVLGGTTPVELDDFLNNIQEYCDEVGRVIGVGPLDFSCSSSPGDVYDLLKVLRSTRVN